MEAFQVDILTPNQVVAKSLKADWVSLMTEKGEIQILPKHTHLVTKIATGILRVHSSEGTHLFTTTTGLCKVMSNQITILSNASEKVEEIDRSRAEASKEKALNMLSGDKALSDYELIKYRRKFLRAETRLYASLLNKK